MASRNARTALAALALAALVGPASAAGQGETTDVAFRQMRPDAQEAQIVSVKLPEVAATKGAVVETALVPLDNTDTASVIVRVVSPKTCDTGGKRCRTVALRAGAKDWDVVFDRRASALQLGAHGFGTMRRITVDGGSEAWDWNGRAYHMNVDATGTPVKLAEVSSPAAAGVIVQQFGQGARILSDRRGKVKVSAAALDLNGKGAKDQLLVRLEGPGVCGIRLGCPWRVLVKDGQGYRTLLNGFGSQDIAVMSVARGDGWRDVAVDLPGGHAVFGWSGKQYGLAELVNDQRPIR